MILLSPGDVWVGTLSTDANGNVILYSKDDSNYENYAVYNQKVTQLSSKNPGEAISVNLSAPDFGAAGGFKSGYVEFYPVFAIDEVASAQAGWTVALKDPSNNTTKFDNYDYFGNQPDSASNSCLIGYHIDKNAIAQRYECLAYQGAAIDSKFGRTCAQFQGDNVVRNVGDWLIGEVTVSSDIMKAAMSIPMLAVSDAEGAIAKTANGYGTTPWSNTQIKSATTPSDYINNTAVKSLFNVSDIMTMYKNDGKNTNILFTHWNDQTLNQSRVYQVMVRNLTECKRACSYTSCPAPVSSTFSGCLTCNTPISSSSSSVSSLIDPYSGKVPAECTPKAGCFVKVNNEFGQLSLSTIIGATQECNGDWTEGWIDLRYVDGSVPNNNQVIATQMKANVVNGQVSYN